MATLREILEEVRIDPDEMLDTEIKATPAEDEQFGVRLPDHHPITREDGSAWIEAQIYRKPDTPSSKLIEQVAIAMFAPLETEGFHPSASQRTEAERVIALVQKAQ